MVNVTRRSVRRYAPGIAVVGGCLETAWNARKCPGGRTLRRHLANKSTRKRLAAEARLRTLDANRARIADLKAAGLPLPGQKQSE